jgi:hypothetical protein
MCATSGRSPQRQRSAAQRSEGVCLFARVRFDPLEHLERDQPADLNTQHRRAKGDERIQRFVDRQQTHFVKREAQQK